MTREEGFVYSCYANLKNFSDFVRMDVSLASEMFAQIYPDWLTRHPKIVRMAIEYNTRLTSSSKQ
jgi:hypothetical protein